MKEYGREHIVRLKTKEMYSNVTPDCQVPYQNFIIKKYYILCIFINKKNVLRHHQTETSTK